MKFNVICTGWDSSQITIETESADLETCWDEMREWIKNDPEILKIDSIEAAFVLDPKPLDDDPRFSQERPVKMRQQLLLDGMNCCSGQLDLF